MGRKHQKYNESGHRLVTGTVAILPSSSGKYNEPMILLINSRSYPNEWILPKGGWEIYETAEAAALRETWEEAGCRGTVVNEIYRCIDATKKEPTEFIFFEMHVSEVCLTWPEQGERNRKWVTLKEALQLCTRKHMLEALKTCSLYKLNNKDKL